MAALKIKHLEKVDALSKLGLTEEILENAIRRGEIARDSCTKNDPTCAPGFTAWAKTVRALRDTMMPKGWTRRDDQNFPTVLSPNQKIAIAVATGNEATGVPTADPSMKYSKGAAAQSAVELNQSYLFPEMQAEKTAEAERLTWILLRRRVGEMVYAELSLPALMTKDGHIAKWDTRIILNSIPIDPDIEMQDDSSDDIDVQVIRRSN
jgi:hypothetical protein